MCRISVAHWDEIEWFRQEAGEMAASWCRIGDAAGTAAVGVNRLRIEPGRLSTPPHSHVSHCLRAGDDGMTVLTYGTREPNDMAYYPRTGTINVRGLGVIGRIEQADPDP